MSTWPSRRSLPTLTKGLMRKRGLFSGLTLELCSLPPSYPGDMFPTKAVFTGCSSWASPSPAFLIVPCPLAFSLLHIAQVSLLLKQPPNSFSDLPLFLMVIHSYFSPLLFPVPSVITDPFSPQLAETWLQSHCSTVTALSEVCSDVCLTRFADPFLVFILSPSPSHVAVWKSGWWRTQGPPLPGRLPWPESSCWAPLSQWEAQGSTFTTLWHVSSIHYGLLETETKNLRNLVTLQIKKKTSHQYELKNGV